MAVIFGIGYLVIGFVQFFAILDALEIYLDWGVLNFVIAVPVTYIPILGSVLGVWGAMEAWGWTLIQALALFFWYIPAGTVVYIIGIFASAIDD